MSYTRTKTFSGAAAAADVGFELDAMRTAINTGMVAGDVGAGAIDSQRIYKPDAYGFPLRETVGQFTGMAARHHGANDGVAGYAKIAGSGQPDGWTQWNLLRERVSIHLDVLERTNESASGSPVIGTPVIGMMIRKDVEANTVVEAHASWAYALMYQDYFGLGGRYPGEGGWPGGDSVGRFVLRYQQVGPTVGAITTRTRTNRRIFPHLDGNGLIEHYNVWHSFNDAFELASAGTYDFWVEYRLLTAPPGTNHQVSIGARNFVIETWRK